MKTILSALCVCICIHLIGNEIDTWSSPPETISTTGIDSSAPSIGMDESGNAVALWLEGDVVVSKNKPLSGSWSSANTLSSTGATTPKLVVDPTTGDATAIWVEGGLVKSASQPFGSSWGSSTTLSASSSSEPSIAIDPATGDIVAVWLTGSTVMSETKLAGSSWTGSPDTLSSASSAFPQVAIGADGTVVAVWHTLNGVTSLNNVNAANKSLGGSWSTATIVSDPARNSVFAQVGVDTNGNAVALWFSYDLSDTEAFINVMVASSSRPALSSWTTPVDISAPSIRSPSQLMSKVLFNPASRDVMAVWSTRFGNASDYLLQSSTSPDFVHWDNPAFIDVSLYSFSIDAVSNGIGDAFAIYMSYDSGSNSVVINTIESRVGGINTGVWTSPVTLSDTDQNGYPQISSVITGGTDCNALAAWVSFDGSNNVIQTSTGTGTLVAPPTDLAVVQSVNNFEVFQEYYNTLSWTASTEPSLVAYGIYRNGILIDVIDPSLLDYVDHNQIQNGHVVYGVSAFDNATTESMVATITFP